MEETTPVREITVDAMADTHVHLRESANTEIMRSLIGYSIQGGADIIGMMPNTVKGLKKAEDVIAYWEKAKSLVPEGKSVSFLPYIMINEETTLQDIDETVAAGIFDGKVYPKYRTTQSDDGVTRYGKIIPTIAHCGKVGLRVHMHPEHPVMDYSHRHAELAFVPIIQMLLEETDTKIVWEHGSDSRCITHWKRMAAFRGDRFSVTLCAHHLAANEDEVRGDVSATCNPSIKPEDDRLALIRLVKEDHDWVSGISDSAFHSLDKKHVFNGKCSCGCLNAPELMPIHAHALDDLLETEAGVAIFNRFVSGNVRKRYNLPPASRQVTLVRIKKEIPRTYPIGDETGLPFWGQKEILWQIRQEN